MPTGGGLRAKFTAKNATNSDIEIPQSKQMKMIQAGGFLLIGMFYHTTKKIYWANPTCIDCDDDNELEESFGNPQYALLPWYAM